MRTLLRRAVLAAVPAVTLPVALLAVPGPAQAFPTPTTISIVHQTPIVGGGALVTVIYRCPAAGGGGAVIFVTVEQGPNSGTTNGGFVCDGAKIAVQLNVPAGPVGPYVPGNATATAHIDADLGGATAQTTVKLK
jgi:hypothetical protein